MIGLNQKCVYALRALYVLAREYHGGLIAIPRICSEANAPPRFIQGILLELRKAGVLESRRGPLGGYRLVSAPNQISVGSIIRILNGPLTTACGRGRDLKPCDGCRDGKSCPTYLMMSDIREVVTSILDSRTLLEGCRESVASSERIAV